MKREPATDGFTFEQALAELDRVVRDLEDGQIGLEDSLHRYEHGVVLLQRCYGQLRQAEQRILELVGLDDAGAPRVRPFEHTATAEPARDPELTGAAPVPFALKDYLQESQALVEAQLRWFLERDDPPQPLREAMAYSLLAPGKRLRPVLVLMAARAAGAAVEAALPAACAVEMIHTYSLIHDDLPAMDDDDLRRGLPTCHKKFGEALAILAGDGLLTLAFQVLAEQYPPRTAAACCKELARGSGWSGMVGGQVEDLAWERGVEGEPHPKDPLFPRSEQPRSLAALEHVHLHKTGALFRASLKLGVWAAQGENGTGPDRDLLDRLDVYARCFGLIFQITDDLLDVEGTAAETGKRTQKDAARGKLTYPGLLGIEESRHRARALGEEASLALAPLGAPGEPLEALLHHVLTRDR